MLKSQRIALLVDSENLEISVSRFYEPAKALRQTHLAYPDWLKIIEKVVGNRTLVRNIYYKKRERSVSRKFQEFWEKRLDGEIKQPIKSVDPYIIVDAITLAEKADVVVLLAGDKDYLPLIWYLKSKGCKVEMAAFPDAVSAHVREAADNFHELAVQDTVVLAKSAPKEEPPKPKQEKRPARKRRSTAKRPKKPKSG